MAGRFRWRSSMLLVLVFWWSAWSQNCYLVLSIKSAFLNPVQPPNNKLLLATPCSVSVPWNKCLLSAKYLWAPNNFPWYRGNICLPGTIFHPFIKVCYGENCHQLLAASKRAHNRSLSIHKWTSKSQSKQSSSPSKTLPILSVPGPYFPSLYIIAHIYFSVISDSFWFLHSF